MNIYNNLTIHQCLKENNRKTKLYTDGEQVFFSGYPGLGTKYNKALETIYFEESEKGTNIFTKSHISNDVNFHLSLIDILNKEHIKEIEENYNNLFAIKNIITKELIAPVKTMQSIYLTFSFSCITCDKGIYLGESFENLANKSIPINNMYHNQGIIIIKEKEGYYKISGETGVDGRNTYLCQMNNNGIYGTKVLEGDIFISYGMKININGIYMPIKYKYIINATITDIDEDTQKIVFNKDTQIVNDCLVESALPIGVITDNIFLDLREHQITKTKIKKPFIKNNFPPAKLIFKSDLTTKNTSFILKGVTSEINKDILTDRWLIYRQGVGEDARTYELQYDNRNFLLSDLYQGGVAYRNKGISTQLLEISFRNSISYIKKIYWYDSILNQQELENERDKNFSLRKNYE